MNKGRIVSKIMAEHHGWRDGQAVSEQVLTALISASAGLIGAMVGFAASFFSSKRTLDQAKEQRRFERAQELQAEVVPQLLRRVDETIGSPDL